MSARRFILGALAFWLAASSSLFTPLALALTTQQYVTIFSRPGWALPTATLDANFATNQYWLPEAAGPLVVSRASAKTCADLSGNYIQVASNVLCQTNQGALIEEARTNSIRNSTMVGAVAGTPGTLPTNWAWVNVPSGITTSVVGTGVEQGINYVDISVSGTPGATTVTTLQFDSYTAFSVVYGQPMSGSVFAYLIGGANTNVVNSQIVVGVTSVGGTGLGSNSPTVTPGAGPLGLSLQKASLTPTAATVANGYYGFRFSFTSGQAVNQTIRLGWPQLELNTAIPGTVASAVAAGTGTGGVDGTSVYSVSGGTCATAPKLNVTWSGGVLAVNSVAGAGSCSVLPPSPATLTYVSGTATGWTGATVTLTAAANITNGVSTSPILTSAGAATRAADVVYWPIKQLPSGIGLYAIATMENPATNISFQYPLSAWNNISNFAALVRYAGTPYFQEAIGGVTTTSAVSGSWAQNTSGKLAGYFSNNSIAAVFNNGAVSTASPTGVTPGIGSLYIGSVGNGTGYCNCYVSRAALAPSSLNGY